MAFLLYLTVYSNRDWKWGRATERVKGSVSADFTRRPTLCKYANLRILFFSHILRKRPGSFCNDFSDLMSGVEAGFQCSLSTA